MKLRPSSALRVAELRAGLRPLFETRRPFGIGAEPDWFVAELADGAATPWDLAHARVAEQLGVAESDVLFVEPDLLHDLYRDPRFQDPNEIPLERPFALGEDCGPVPQDDRFGKAVGPDAFAWHLGDDFTQLAAARAAVEFAAPRTRIAHLDTGYSRSHATTPQHILHERERNFVPGEAGDDGAQDPGRRTLILDASGHGTGTLSILAGGPVPSEANAVLGGAPGAEILPLRIASSVVLLFTSAFAQALQHAIEQRCDVLSMSMGGLPSRVWRETVDRAYLVGLCLVTAAGNNFRGLPTRNLIYPARYGRVLAVAGVMADGRPYQGLAGPAPWSVFEGNAGPERLMASAIAAYTPNIPWARFGCVDHVRLDGEGTSAATPQVAAAAALWIEKYKQELPRDWRRVEAVRHALFASAKPPGGQRPQLGNGILQAAAALGVRPRLGLAQTGSDSDSFALFRVLTGLGVAEPVPRQQMFDLELMQRWILNQDLQKIVEDPEAAAPDPSEAQLKRLMEALIEDQGASVALRRHLADRYPVLVGRGKSAPRTDRSAAVITETLAAFDEQPELRDPPFRRLRVYALDPSLSVRLATARLNDVTLAVRWEELGPGPVGEYVEVKDVDATGRQYAGVNLDDPRLLASDGWAPSEGNPQFHQQMVYAVSMMTVEHFERALGRPVLWRARSAKRRGAQPTYTRRLTLRPHALRQANAYYSPDEVALLFGYFEATADDPAQQVPGSRVYTCLAHDIVAHEATHAVLDGMYRRFNEPSNPDVLALHEGFADIVALMQRFGMRDVLAREIARSRGNIEAESMLGSLAAQFGRATGRGGALREAIGRIERGVWMRLQPDPMALRERLAPHARGAVLVAAVFDAFVAIYKQRTSDLLRIATGGTGVLPEGAIHPDLVGRLADEAAKSASHVLTMCIRALDYLPPVDVTFFEYLRALITADRDVVLDDRYEYRVAFVEAFRRHGIYPMELGDAAAGIPRTLSVDTLLWQGLDHGVLTNAVEKQYRSVIDSLKRYADACSYLEDREALFGVTRDARRELRRQLRAAFRAAPAFATSLGLDAAKRFEVHELRRAMRVRPDGRHIPQVIVALTQSTKVRAQKSTGTPSFRFRGGTTLVVDLVAPEVKYNIYKSITSAERLQRTARFTRTALADPLQARLFAEEQREPFAALHMLAESGT